MGTVEPKLNVSNPSQAQKRRCKVPFRPANLPVCWHHLKISVLVDFMFFHYNQIVSNIMHIFYLKFLYFWLESLEIWQGIKSNTQDANYPPLCRCEMHRWENNEQKFMRIGIIDASINKKIVNNLLRFAMNYGISCRTNKTFFSLQVIDVALLGIEA